MRVLAITALLLMLSPPTNAICILPTDHSQEESIQQAKTLFVATITHAKLDPDYQQLAKDKKRQRERPWYTVRYEYEVAIRIKGDPSSIPYLITGGAFNDPKSNTFRTFGEQSRFVPGDSILVIANKAGPVPISWLKGCTDSIPWDDEAQALLKRAGLGQAP